jgi:hypothetical protein
VGHTLSEGLVRFLDGLSPIDREHALGVLLSCESVDVDGAPRFATGFPKDALLLTEDGFVVVRSTSGGALRSVVTCDAGPGRILLPPAAEEVLVGLGKSRLSVIDREARAALVQIPALAERLVEQLVLGLGEKQDATANFAPTHHIDRVRRKLLQLARSYGHVVRDGVRIDFPVSHALLAEMVGSSRETVTRAVDELQRARFVDRRGSTYHLLLPPESVDAELER